MKTPGLWPASLDARDPFEEGGPPDEFLQLWREVDLSGQGQDTLAQRAAALGLDAPLVPEPPLPSPPPDRAPSLEALVRVGADFDPALGASAPDLVLGPWGMRADPHSRAVAMAWGAMHPLDEPPPSAVERWLRGRGMDRQLRASLSALLRVPPAPYQVLSWEPDGHGSGWATLAPVLELGVHAPAGRVWLDRPAIVAGAVREGGGLVARVLGIAGDPPWIAVAAIASPRADLPPYWLERATWRARSAGAPVRTIPDVLRARGPHLVRRMLEREWT